MKRANFSRTILAGLTGGLAFNITMFLTFRLIGFGINCNGFLLNPDFQSSKLIAVWSQLKPLPLIVTNPARIAIGLTLLTIIHSFLYRELLVCWKVGVINRALRMTVLIFLFTFLFWEFFTPYNQLGEPFFLIVIELSFWFAIALAESFAIVWVMERNTVNSKV